MNTKKFSHIDLEELDALINRIQFEIEHFAHVSDLLPKNFINQLEKIKNNINDELIRREC
jgi:hypothetical protein